MGAARLSDVSSLDAAARAPDHPSDRQDAPRGTLIMAAGRILVVDDDPATVLLCSRVLQKAGYAITIARDAGQAVAEATAVNRPSSSRTS